MCLDFFFFFFKQKTAYEMRISDWSSDVCSSDLLLGLLFGEADAGDLRMAVGAAGDLLLLHRVDVVEAGDLLDADDALVLGLVGQHRRAGDVADGVDAGLPRAAVDRKSVV